MQPPVRMARATDQVLAGEIGVPTRIAMWASAGILVAGFWALFAIATFPLTSERMQDAWTLISLPCPVATVGIH